MCVIVLFAAISNAQPCARRLPSGVISTGSSPAICRYRLCSPCAFCAVLRGHVSGLARGGVAGPHALGEIHARGLPARAQIAGRRRRSRPGRSAPRRRSSPSRRLPPCPRSSCPPCRSCRPCPCRLECSAAAEDPDFPPALGTPPWPPTPPAAPPCEPATGVTGGCIRPPSPSSAPHPIEREQSNAAALAPIHRCEKAIRERFPGGMGNIFSAPSFAQRGIQSQQVRKARRETEHCNGVIDACMAGDHVRRIQLRVHGDSGEIRAILAAIPHRDFDDAGDGRIRSDIGWLRPDPVDRGVQRVGRMRRFSWLDEHRQARVRRHDVAHPVRPRAQQAGGRGHARVR